MSYSIPDVNSSFDHLLRTCETCCEDLSDFYYHKYKHRLSEEDIEDFEALTYFKGYEIWQAFDFYAFTTRNKYISPRPSLYMGNTLFFNRMQKLRVCPFRDRLEKIFSIDDFCMTFESFLDMMSAFSSHCPAIMKAEVAFKMYDFDEDGILSQEDIEELLRRLSGDYLKDEEYAEAAKIVINSVDKDKDDYIDPTEFILFMEKLPEFPSSFYQSIKLVRDLRTLQDY